MALKITGGSIESDKPVVLMPLGVVGEVQTADGTVYDLGNRTQIAIEVESADHAAEVALEVSRRVGESDEFPDIEFDEGTSKKNLADNLKHLNKKGK